MKHLRNQNSAIRSWPIKTLTSAVIISLTAMVSQTVSSAERKPIGDLEIYKAATPSGPKIFMMLDISGSMGRGSIKEDYGNDCSEGGGDGGYKPRPDEEITATILNKDGSTASNITYRPSGCQTTKGGGKANPKEFDRLSRLQMSLIELFADKISHKTDKDRFTDKASISNEYEIGVGVFSGDKGKVITTLGPLDAAQRINLIQSIVDIGDGGWTPTAHALAEAGAYMMGTTTKKSGYTSYSGFDSSVSTSKKDSKYISPLTTERQCSGNGIYLMTDGEPNRSNESRAKALMNQSLAGSSLSVNSCSGLTGGNSDGAWGCMGEYAQLLRDPTNPIKQPIKIATVGFGKDFAGITAKKTIFIEGEPLEVTNCEGAANTTSDKDALNLCRLGQRWGDDELADNTKKPKIFGDGGFYYVKGDRGNLDDGSDDPSGTATIQSSLLDFAASLDYVISTSPSGTITVPDDPYRASNQLPYAYLPMLDPNIASTSSIWKGNLKKYNLNNGTLYGKSSNSADINNPLDNLLYKDASGRLNELTRDIWQAGDYQQKDGGIANNAIDAGGVYAQLKSPKSGLGSLRTLYVEDVTSATDSKPILRKISVNTSGKAVGFNLLVDSVYTELNKRRLLSFLGFDGLITLDGDAANNTPVANLTLAPPAQEIKVLGGVVHSKPTSVSYSSTLEDNGRIIDPRDDYVLFGSMEGALHLVDADDGKESIAIIPKRMLKSQPEALVVGSKKTKVGEPYFGVDAPWLVTTDYKYDLDNNKVTVDTAENRGMFAYGGLRMGGEGLSGINITDKSAPKMLFTITSAGLDSSTTAKSSATGFGRIGQIWSKPVEAKIRMTKNAEPIDVLVFGGGYDMGYEQDTYKPTATTPARGNAIYMINAKTGELIWSTSGETGGNKNTKTASMIHSIVGGITVLDRDNDGLMDHLYAADLGGQVFRADFENARPAKYGFEEVSNASNKRVVRVINTAPSAPNDKYAYRFYERPVVSFYRSEAGPNNGKIFAMVNVISGNRSAPLSTLRDGDTYANRVYGIIDNDVTNMDLYKAGFTTTVNNLTEGNLVNLSSTLGKNPTKNQKETAKASMIAGTKQGWYYPLTRFDGYNNVRYSKGVGDSVVINDLLYTTVYNPDKQYYEVDSCTARIAGGSERQLYCLPYGICMDDTSKSGTGGYIPAGQGVQEITLGAYNKDNTDLKILIGTSTITDRIDAAKRSGYGNDANKNGSNIKNVVYGNNGKPTQSDGNVIGDGSAAEFIFNERYTLQPRAWYEQSQ